MKASKNKEAIDKRSVSVYSIIILIISYFLGRISSTESSLPASTFVFTIVQLYAFIMLGVLHFFVVNKRLNMVEGDFSRKSLLYTCLLSFLTFLILIAINIVTDKQGWLMALASASAFLFPSVINSAWLLFQTSNREIKVWYPSEIVNEPNKRVVYLDGITVKIKVAGKFINRGEDGPKVTLSGVVPFGKLFTQFLANANFLDYEQEYERQKADGWIFLSERWSGFGNRMIDPNLTLRENRVKNNAVIVAKRVKRE